MTIRIPIRTIYNANGDPTGLGEFQSGEKIGYLHGGTGLTTLGTAGQTLVVNDSASGLEWGAGFAASDARTAISVTDAGGDGSLAYNNSTGVLTYTGPSASEVRAHFSAAGDLTYNQSTGEFSFDVEDVYTQANFDSDFNTSLDDASLGGTGLTYTSGTNTLSITNTGVTAAEYGSASLVPVITVNAQGQITAASTVSVAGVSSTSWDSSTGNLIINTADGGSFYTKVTLDPYDTDDLTEGSTNLYYTDARADARIAAATTDDLTEGSTNLYYTDARARSAVSVTDAGGDGSLAYNSSTGVLTYTGPSASEVRAHFSAGTGVTISNGQVSIGQAVGTTDSAVFASLQTTGNIVVGGDLTVNGTTTTVNSTTLDVADKNITVASGAADAAAANGAGLTVDGASATITYSSTGDKWAFNKPIDVSGNIIVSGTVDGRDLATDGSKLDGIESGATADQSASEILTAIKTVDGAGSGLDADTLDGTQAAAFALLAGATFAGDVSAPNFNSTSDAQLKENIETITSALDKVDSIRGVTFNWKDTGKSSMGVIAQEVEPIAPEVVSEIDGYKAVNYDGLIGLLIESIKELKQEISDLKQK